MEVIGKVKNTSLWDIPNLGRVRFDKPVVVTTFKVDRGIWRGHVLMRDVDDNRRFIISAYVWAYMLREQPEIFMEPGIFFATLTFAKKCYSVFMEPVKREDYILIPDLEVPFEPNLDEILGW